MSSNKNYSIFVSGEYQWYVYIKSWATRLNATFLWSKHRKYFSFNIVTTWLWKLQSGYWRFVVIIKEKRFRWDSGQSPTESVGISYATQITCSIKTRQRTQTYNWRCNFNKYKSWLYEYSYILCYLVQYSENKL